MFKAIVMASLGVLAVGTSIAARADDSDTTTLDPSNQGYYVDHQTALDRGGVSSYVGRSVNERQAPGTAATSEDQNPGSYLSHTQVLERGGVSSYVGYGNDNFPAPHAGEAGMAGNDLSTIQRENFLFDRNSSKLSSQAMDPLHKIGSALAANPNLRVEVDGFTDNTGSASYDLSLSDRRAETVADVLKSCGARPDQVVVQPNGGSEPIADNSSAAGRALNRRVEIREIDNQG